MKEKQSNRAPCDTCDQILMQLPRCVSCIAASLDRAGNDIRELRISMDRTGAAIDALPGRVVACREWIDVLVARARRTFDMSLAMLASVDAAREAMRAAFPGLAIVVDDAGRDAIESVIEEMKASFASIERART